MKGNENNGFKRLLCKVGGWIKTAFFKAINSLKALFLRQRTLASYDGAESSEESKLAYGFGAARIISVILLVVLLLITILFGSGTVSYEKVYYMFKDIGYIKSYVESEPSALNYSHPVRNQSFTVFKNGLAVASDSEIKLFTSTGRMTLTSGSDFTNPKMSASDEYLLIYDQGRRGFALYNSFICVYSDQLDYPIAYADMADNGSFLIVTSSSSYASVVKLYNHKMELISEYSKNDRVISASLSSDGRYASVLSLRAEGGSAVSVLDVVDTKRSELISSVEMTDAMPYACEFLGDDRILTLLDDRFTVTDRSGKKKQEYSYPSRLCDFDISHDSYALLFEDADGSTQSLLHLFDGEGRSTLSSKISGTVMDMKLSGEFVYILHSNTVIRISTSLGIRSQVEVERGSSHIEVFPNGKVAVCSQNLARYISFD